MRTFRGVVLAILVVVTPLVFATPALAQNNDNGVGIGALGGITRTSLRGTDADDISAGTGAMFGIWFGGNRNGRVGFMGELSYVQKKIKDSADSTTSLTTNYLEIPAVLRINIGSKSRGGVSVYGLVGPVFDFRISSKLVFEGVEEDTTDFDGFTSVDIGLLAGIGIEVARLGVEVRGNWGMRQLATDEAEGSLPAGKAFSLQIVGKIRFN